MRKIAVVMILGVALSCTNNQGDKRVIHEDVISGSNTAEAPSVTANFNGEHPERKNFNTFLEKFSKDSIYQLSHVKFPLKHTLVPDPVMSHGDDMQDSTFVVHKADYTLWNLLTSSPEVYGDTVDINVSFKDKMNAVAEVSGREGRIHIEFYFKKEQADWLLHEIIDYSI